MKTPQENYPELARALNLPEVWLKREDLHHFGSHKGRSIPFMMDHYIHRKEKNDSTSSTSSLRGDSVESGQASSPQDNFVISSSGNAALAAASYARSHNENNPDKKITLHIFVGQKINDTKFARLQSLANESILITQTDKPKQAAFTAEKNGSIFLRQSTDDLALKGYYELAKELDHIPNLQAIFIPTSSGTTAQALAEYFQSETQKPEIHIVQTSAVHPIADALQNPTAAPITETSKTLITSIASAIVDRVALRKPAVADAVLKSNGTGWIATDDDIRAASALVQKTANIITSPNSALSIAGLQLAQKNGKTWTGAVACLITGA